VLESRDNQKERHTLIGGANRRDLASRSLDATMNIEFEAELDQTPDAWLIRLRYAEWLKDAGYKAEAYIQKWMAENQKCPGPKCVLEGAWYEASWWHASQENSRWTFDYKSENFPQRVHPFWCLPGEIFDDLDGYIDSRNRLDKGWHNRFARSWTGRRQAEAALIQLVKPKLRLWRSLDASWQDEDLEIPPAFSRYDHDVQTVDQREQGTRRR
jgi:hypothetical protein